MSTKKIFNVNDKVFAKIRGYPPWPAIIFGVNNVNSSSRQTYNVYFCGTGKHAECKSEELFSYEENKSKLGKLNKHKYFEEALLQIEEDVESFDLPENGTQERAQEFIKPSYTSTIEQESQPTNELDKTSKIERKKRSSSSETEEKLTADKSNVSKKKKLSSYEKSLKISVIKPQELLKKSVKNKVQVPENLSPRDIQCIKLGEILKSSTLEKASGQKYEIADKNISTDVQTSEIFVEHFKTLNTPIESVLETIKTGNYISEIKKSATPDCEISSNSSDLVHVPYSDYKIKEEKYSYNQNEVEVPESLMFSDENSISSEKQYNSMNESDTSLDQHFEIMSSNSSYETQKSSKNLVNHAVTPHINDTTSLELKSLKNEIDKNNELPIVLKNLMINAISNLKITWKTTKSNKNTIVELLQIENDLLDHISHLRRALESDHADYDEALNLLEKISKLKLNALMLKKNVAVVGIIKKITEINDNLSKQKTIDQSEKVIKIQRYAETVYNKFISLFTVLEGQTFQEVFKKEVRDFYAKTKNLSLMQINGITSDTFDD